MNPVGIRPPKEFRSKQVSQKGYAKHLDEDGRQNLISALYKVRAIRPHPSNHRLEKKK